MNFITKTISALLVLSAAALSLPASAGGTVTATVLGVYARNDGVTYVLLSPSTGNTGCGVSNPGYWAVKDETTVAGKAQMTIMLGAMMSGRQVTLTGAGTCLRLGGFEDIETARVQ